MVLLDIVVNVWNCGGGESNLCCQVGTVPVVLVGGLAYRTLWSTKILSSCFSPCLWRDLRVSVGPRLWNDCKVFVSLFSTFSSVMHCAFKMYFILSKLLILLLTLCIQLFLLNHCRQSSVSRAAAASALMFHMFPYDLASEHSPLPIALPRHPGAYLARGDAHVNVRHMCFVSPTQRLWPIN